MKKMRIIKISAFVCAAAILFSALGCSCFERKNRRFLNILDKHIQPKSTAVKISLSPICIPAATMAYAIDQTLIHPAYMLPKAADDVYQLYWKPRNMSTVRKSLLFIPVVALTPPTFVGDWTMRILFPIE